MASLDALGIGAADPLRQLLADPAGDDRSADTYAAACDMHRRGFNADQIAAVLLDPELPISAHCLAQANPERAAHRAVERAQSAVEADGDGFEVLADAHRAAAAISAIPFAWPAAHTIPQRRWLYGRQLQRGNVGAIVAPGATGKTALTVGIALAMASGRPLLGHEVHGGPKRVWLWNLEDAREELNRSIIAAAMFHTVAPADAAGLFVNSGLTDESLCTAVATRHGFTVLQPVYKALAEEIISRRIDCLIVDPFVSSHAVNENDNGAIDAVAKEWAKVAAAADCVIVLVHHTSKAAGMEVTVDRARGASALTNAARSVTVLNRMTDDEFNRFGLSLNAEPGDAGGARRYFRTFDDKANRAPAADGSDWYRMESVDLPNGEGDDWIGDSVGVATRYYPPAAGTAEPLAPTMAADVQGLIAQGEWRESDKAEHWAGEAVAQALGLDASDKGHRVRIKAVLRDLLTDGTLAREERPDASRRRRWWIVVGSALPAQPAKSASSPEGVSAPVLAPVQITTGALEHDGPQAVLRSSQIPLGIDCSGAEQTGVGKRRKTTGAKESVSTAAAALGKPTPCRWRTTGVSSCERAP
ncbi:AAA family ATPase [Sphingomonas aerolata]|uniref:AAA family ATPase n=1 Tax=Sphingomonas aerolata TaxID=185951 RepID=UPI0035A5D6F5